MEKNIDYKFYEENYDLEGKIIDKYDTLTLRAIYGDERLRDRFGRDIIYQRQKNNYFLDETLYIIFKWRILGNV